MNNAPEFSQSVPHVSLQLRLNFLQSFLIISLNFIENLLGKFSGRI